MDYKSRLHVARKPLAKKIAVANTTLALAGSAMPAALLAAAPSMAWAEGEFQDVSTAEGITQALSNGGAVKLSADISASGNLQMNSGKDVTIDLNGHTLACGAFLLLSGKLTVVNTGSTGSFNTQMNVYCTSDSDSAAGAYNSFTLDSGASITGSGWGVILREAHNTHAGYGSKIDIKGKVEGCVWVMGNITEGNSVVDVSGTIDATRGGMDVGLALQGVATVNVVDGASITSSDNGKGEGIEVRAGTLNVSGGKIYGTTDGLEVTPNGNGTTTTGAGITIAQHTTRKDIVVNISGGEVSGTVALLAVNPQGNETGNGTLQVNVTGGSFSGTSTSAAAVNGDDRVLVSLSGGTYRTDPSATDKQITYKDTSNNQEVTLNTKSYVAESYTAFQTDTSLWQVIPSSALTDANNYTVDGLSASYNTYFTATAPEDYTVTFNLAGSTGNPAISKQLVKDTDYAGSWSGWSASSSEATLTITGAEGSAFAGLSKAQNVALTYSAPAPSTPSTPPATTTETTTETTDPETGDVTTTTTTTTVDRTAGTTTVVTEAVTVAAEEEGDTAELATTVKTTVVKDAQGNVISETSAEVTLITDAETGEPAEGVVTASGEKYLAIEGVPAEGITEYNGKTYLATEDGTLAEGLTEYNGKTYLAGTDGALKKSWKIAPDGAWHYFSTSDYSQVTGWTRAGTARQYYYFDPATGKMAHNTFVRSAGQYYFFGARGNMLTNSFVQYKGHTYYVGARGAAAWNTTVAGHRFNSRGWLVS